MIGAIIKILKTIFDLIAKACAFLLVKLGLWVPALVIFASIVFCAIQSIPLDEVAFGVITAFAIISFVLYIAVKIYLFRRKRAKLNGDGGQLDDATKKIYSVPVVALQNAIKEGNVPEYNGHEFTQGPNTYSSGNQQQPSGAPQMMYGVLPPQTFPQPQQGYVQPQQGYAQPQQGYAVPQQGYVQPQQGYAVPPQGYAQPPQGYVQPPQGYAQPPQGYVPPQQEGGYVNQAQSGQGQYSFGGVDPYLNATNNGLSDGAVGGSESGQVGLKPNNAYGESYSNSGIISHMGGYSEPIGGDFSGLLKKNMPYPQSPKEEYLTNKYFSPSSDTALSYGVRANGSYDSMSDAVINSIKQPTDEVPLVFATRQDPNVIIEEYSDRILTYRMVGGKPVLINTEYKKK